MTFLLSSAALGAEVTIKTLTNNGSHVDWCAKSGQVAFDRLNDKGYFSTWLMNADGTQVRQLTDAIAALPHRHTGMPAWHPGCRYLAIQVQQANAPRQHDSKSVPGSGIFNDLWVITADGKNAWKLVEVSDEISKDAQGILHPQFSHDGKHLLWAQRIGAGASSLGSWVLKLADFSLNAQGVPTLNNIQTLVPGGKPAFFEGHGFSPDDRRIVFSSTNDLSPDIYTCDLAGQNVQRLTEHPHVWNDHARYSPDGQTIVWMSSEGLRFKQQPFDLQTEFWFMNADGSEKRRLTYFHQPGHPHFIKKDFAVASDVSWSADGRSLIGLVVTGRPDGAQRDVGSIVRIDIK
jgi:Tol biopolymer transport system component